MNLTDVYARIKVLHPTIKDSEFEIVDLIDGGQNKDQPNPTITRWTFPAPQPDEAALAAVDPTQFRKPVSELAALESALIKKGVITRGDIDTER